MIAVDDSGNVHVVWTNGLTSDYYGPRHVYYNRWGPQFTRFAYDSGLQVDTFRRGGYVNLTLDREGYPLAAFHGVMTDSSGTAFHVALCRIGCDDITLLPNPRNGWLVWPKVVVDVNNHVHVLANRDDSFLGFNYEFYYAQGAPAPDSSFCEYTWQPVNGGSVLQSIDTLGVASYVIAASRTSPRVAMGWLRAYYRDPAADYQTEWKDVELSLSGDGGETWGPRLNITQFTPGDTACLAATHDTLHCNRDTLWAHADLSLLFDRTNGLHAAFTTTGYWTWASGHSQGRYSASEGLIWHWSEATGQFSLVADGWIAAAPNLPGAWQRMVCRPSLAVDPSNGYLYCSYARYDTAQVSEGGYFNSDVWISVSTDNGIAWSTGTNVTRTRPALIPTPSGECLSEREPTVAETVSDGALHLSYVLDRDAGAVSYSEGVATLNDFIYQRVPVDSIATTPLMPRYPLHWDSSGFLAAQKGSFIPHPSAFSLSAFPNPFNSTATLRFELPAASVVTVEVFDVLGRSVYRQNLGRMIAGEHRQRFDGSDLSSGVYFAALWTESATRVQKMMLLK
jgi:hypothetical protein